MLLDKDKELCGRNVFSKPENGSQIRESTNLRVWKMVTENVGVAQLASECEFGLCNYLPRHTVMYDQFCSVSS